MAKLYFRYGAMNSGKSTVLLQAAHNYEERGMKVILIKPLIDVKGNNKIASRIGLERKVDYLIKNDQSIKETINDKLDSDLHCIIIDESQFLTRKQVEELYYMSKTEEIPIICYGLRTDFLTNGFEGASRLLELADDLQELKTICRCGKKAVHNTRIVNGNYIFEGEQIAIDGVDNITYESLCGKCYIREREKNNKKRTK